MRDVVITQSKGASTHEPRQIHVMGHSNLLAVGLGRHIGDVLVPTPDPRHGFVAGLQCLHREVWLQTDAGRCQPGNIMRKICQKNFTSGWVDVCAAYSRDGLRWYSVLEEDLPG